MLMLLAFMAAFMLTSPAMAAPPEEKAATEEKADDGAPEEAKADAGAPEEAKADAGTPDEAATGGDTGGAEEGDGPAEIKTDEEAVSAVEQIVSAAKGGQWSLVVALSIMLLVYLVKRFGLKDKLPSKVVPWAAAGLSMAGYVAAALMVDGAAMLDAALGGLATGAAAVGLWEMVFKHFLGSKSAEA
jgi:hypothetical protein